jgi:hypothetical protein
MQPLAVSSYDHLIAALRDRQTALGLSDGSLHDLALLQGGYIRPSKRQKSGRTLGRMSFGCVLGALGLKIVLVEDRDALAKVRDLLVARDNAQSTRENTCPAGIKPRDSVLTLLGRAGGYARAAKLSAKQRVKISRKAIRARWSKARAGKIGARARWQER